ncbi:CocE/NonD family hydrolase [Nonomuraea polychroma]|uniref:CocE/NonD family hydrolase n=1 Tax=Nonomuraea polychroma TaxID=46176 RepID=UPI003D8B50A6
MVEKCSGDDRAAGTLAGKTVILYDQGSDPATNKPSDGNPTEVRAHAGATTVSTSKATFDDYGRTLSATDPLSKTTTSTYTPAVGWPTGGITVKDPLGYTTTSLSHTWPPPHEPTPWHLHSGGRLSDEPAADGVHPSRYRYDPGDPTPTVGGTAVGLSAGRKDNRRVEARPDVLTFTSDPLPHDIDVIGPVRARLYARSSLPHVDYFACLCDVSPGGRSNHLCDGIVRLSEPGDVRTADIDLWPLAHRFARGHRIRLQVSSGAHPRFGRNPGTPSPPHASCAHPATRSSTIRTTPPPSGFPSCQERHKTAGPRRNPPRRPRRRGDRAGARRRGHHT